MEIFKLVKELGFETLPMMTDFISALPKSQLLQGGVFERNVRDYKELIVQSPALGQFIPCDKEGKPMEQPESLKGYYETDKVGMIKEKEFVIQFQQAVDAVLFEGWRHDTNASDEDVIFITDGINCLEFEEGSEVKLNEYDPVETFESAINDGVKLTPKIK